MYAGADKNNIDDEEENCKMFAELGIPVKQYNIETDTFVKYYAPQNKEE